MIRSSTSFVDISLLHLLSKLAVIVFCELDEAMLGRYKFLFLRGMDIICKDIYINLG